MTTARAVKPPPMRVAHQLRDEFRDRGTEFTVAEYREALELRLEPYRRQAFSGFVDDIARKIDDQATKERARQSDADQPCLFDGYDLDGEYRLGGGRRVAKRHATFEHALDMLALDRANLAAVQEASERKQQEIERLRDYWGPGITKAQAVAAYRLANPEEACSE